MKAVLKNGEIAIDELIKQLFKFDKVVNEVMSGDSASKKVALSQIIAELTINLTYVREKKYEQLATQLNFAYDGGRYDENVRIFVSGFFHIKRTAEGWDLIRLEPDVAILNWEEVKAEFENIFMTIYQPYEPSEEVIESLLKYGQGHPGLTTLACEEALRSRWQTADQVKAWFGYQTDEITKEMVQAKYYELTE